LAIGFVHNKVGNDDSHNSRTRDDHEEDAGIDERQHSQERHAADISVRPDHAGNLSRLASLDQGNHGEYGALTGLNEEQLKRFTSGLGLEGAPAKEAEEVLKSLYRAYVDLDATLIEVNPLVLTEDNHIVLLDAKMSFDDNALFRHPDIADLRDESEEDPMESRAKEYGLSYIKLSGEIGCMVNGAGLAMATMDIIKLKGSEPANFLDVGGGASTEKVTEAFKIILSDKAVKGILVNIFGGIMRCDVIAEGIIAAAKEAHIHVPLVVRLAGTNVEKGKEILANSGLDVIPADDLNDAAEKVVAAVKGGAK